jgi:hypothetical protein
MSISKTLVFWSLLFSVATCCSLRAQTQSTSGGQKACRKVVQEFYDWYVPKAVQDHAGRPSDIVLEYDRSGFSAELFRKLKEDSEAQAKADDLVGLDSDPFLGGQDTCEPYSLRKVTRTGTRCWVEVHGSSCAKNAKPDVVPELALKSGHWIFVNFHYPQLGKHTDLLSMLSKLSRDRQRPAAK